MRQFFFNLSLAYRAIRTNRLRSVITIIIIGLGIMALVGILTAIEVLKESMYSSFSSLGANGFQVTSEILKKKKRKGGIHISVTEVEQINYEQAKAFRERYRFPATVGLTMSGSGMVVMRYGSEKTNPNISTMGADETYLTITDTKLDAGRNFSAYELQNGSYVCILGNGIARRLFKSKYKQAAGKIISVGDLKYRVIGVMETKGGSMFMNTDNLVLLPIENARAIYGNSERFTINVTVNNIAQKDMAIQEAEGIFRVIRKLPVGSENNFAIEQNDSLANILLDSIKYVRWAALVIGIITLFGSVIGLMNIMLVSVAERTREIGINKALGAKASVIRRQFLTESVLISLLGGLLGIFSGMLVGNLVGLAFDTPFVVPWVWMMTGFSLCAVVGVVSGIYPALKAAKLDPIVALRYE
jgi:putative ABC transport system permease protein